MRSRWLVLVTLLVALIIGAGGIRPTRAAAAPAAPPVPGACVTGALVSGAQYKICVPQSGWNGDLVLWAHGYVLPGDELTFQDELPGDPPIALPTLVQSLGYAFAATTYAKNGLVVPEAQQDLLELLEVFKAGYQTQTGQPYPGRVYITGASMGGLIATLLAEKHPDKFAGALAACGIVGDFRRHVNYWGDFRVVFDYFFPTALRPLQPLAPKSQAWRDQYGPAVTGAVLANPSGARQLIAVTKAPVDLQAENPPLKTIQSVMFYSALSAADAEARLGGNPFDNWTRWYWGSDNDLRLNLRVARFRASPLALAAIRKDYETSGKPRVPIVMPHTTQDEVVRFDQSLLYWLKARPEGAGRVTVIPIPRFGHCNFTASEIVLSFALLVRQATGALPAALAAEVAELDAAPLDTDLTPYLEALRAAEAEDAAQQAQAIWNRVYLPVIIH
ncbi:MAG: alpha/beta hydrolase-fold protein [Chloroflexaceae bacterium]|nr:alpha/beta hydrolase-fold protein [Chloroflexaceae bacterium]